jgi:hypothetical protein
MTSVPAAFPREGERMTEAEWLAGDELWRMLRHVIDAGRFPARKQFLFCVTACRLRGEAVPVAYLPILDELEAVADGPDLPTLEPGKMFSDWRYRLGREPLRSALDDRLQALQERAKEVWQRREAVLARPGERIWEGDPRFEADEAVSYAISGHPFACARGDGQGSILRSPSEAALLRDLLGNPFRPRPALNPAWLAWNGRTVKHLAAALFERRQFDDLPILADALEDAGCADAALLDHLREPGPHARGCWALDLLLGKE